MMSNSLQPVQVVTDVCIDYENQAKLIDKIFELANALAPDEASAAMIFAQFKQELAELGLVLNLIPKEYISLLTTKEAK